ncbi:hypothetical protein [Ancylomarina longa]|uniref:Uncharacterized protein n=1 Tax=Ancylomarina longa TaxID=2487017 RepID=A0A434ATW7_9BACT|nr:hypothetical protein [Ancylomarina longa]RUT77861.1 hypothetical protein DLK05_11015 [Ancylomarina longa]
MTELEAYQETLPEINVVQKEDIKYCNMPLEIFIHEAKGLHKRATIDFTVLSSIGLAQEKLDKLSTLTGALVTAQLNWEQETTERQDAIKTWKDNASDMLELHNDLLENMKFAYRNEPELMDILKGIKEGDTNADAVMDLDRLGTLGKAHPEHLQAINFDLTLCDKATTESVRMGDLLASVNGTMYVDDDKKVIRNKAFTLVKELVDEIREYGKFAFRKDEEHARLYASKYNRHRNKEYRKKQVVDNEE